MLLFAIRYVLLNRSKLDIANHMACFVTSIMFFFYRSNYVPVPITLRRQHIYSSFTGLVPVFGSIFRAPSLTEDQGSGVIRKEEGTSLERDMLVGPHGGCVWGKG